MKIHCPTASFKVRSDSKGDGEFGASRGDRMHLGLDLEVVPNFDVVYSMIDGKLDRIVYPYANDLSYTGLQLTNEFVKVYYFYCKPYHELVGLAVGAGQPIAKPQDISEKYGEEMTPHIHVQVWVKAFQTLGPNNIPLAAGIIINPRILLGE